MIILSLQIANKDGGGDFILLGAGDWQAGKLVEVYPKMQTKGFRKYVLL